MSSKKTFTSLNQPTTEKDGIPKDHTFGQPPKPRVPTLEKRPLYMIGTINFMGFILVFFTLNELATSYYNRGYFVDYTLLNYLLANLNDALFLWFDMVVVATVIWLITVLTIKQYIPRLMGYFCFVVALGTLLLGPILISFAKDFSPLMAGATSMQCIVHSMKMYSYWATNWMIEENLNDSKDGENDKAIRDRSNLSFSHFAKYLTYPTLIFERKWPSTKSIRWVYTFFLFVQMWICFFMIYIFLNNYLVPVYKSIAWHTLVYDVLKMSLPSVAIWMIGFYAVFHCILGMYAELTRFADREFYHDWWNAENFQVWWRQWNRPVHKWMSRHVYSESIKRGRLGKSKAVLVTFLTSAILHEAVLFTAFKSFRPIMSSLILFQIVIIRLSKIKALERTSFGNIIMWITMFVGFPLVQALYALSFKYL